MVKLADWQGERYFCQQHPYQREFRQKKHEVSSEILKLKSSCQGKKTQMNEQTQTQTDKQTKRHAVERP